MTAKQKSEDIYNSNYMLLMEYGEEYSEECLVSILSIKFGVKQCDDIIDEIPDHLPDRIEFFKEVKQYLLEM